MKIEPQTVRPRPPDRGAQHLWVFIDSGLKCVPPFPGSSSALLPLAQLDRIHQQSRCNAAYFSLIIQFYVLFNAPTSTSATRKVFHRPKQPVLVGF